MTDAEHSSPPAPDATEEEPRSPAADLAFLAAMEKRTADAESSEMNGNGHGDERKKPAQLMDDIRKADARAAAEGRPVER